MSDVPAHVASSVAAEGGNGTLGDYMALMKPRVMSLVLFTAFVGMVAAPGSIHPWLGFVALVAIAVGAGASGALNMWYDADIDAVMRRTASRPVPRGAILPGEALGFGLTLAAGSVLTLGLLVDWAAAALLAFTIFFYVVIYTMWLKRMTPQNIVIGGAAGAFPSVIGWTAATGRVDLGAIALFLIIFVWTPPHFWALALWKNVNADYGRAGVPMLPVVAGADETRRQILLYSLVLVPVSVLPIFIGIAGAFYGAAAVILGAIFLHLAIAVHRQREGQAGERALKRLFGFSVLWLFLIFAAILAEHLLGIPAFAPVFA
ncbi:MAG: protoheme IX farnesyltransferase [Alphaproteobacteria bacterium]|nr:protoheme IX farnesyltransferase [Alphaproteobacteria bacterium]